jgi:hypothetical protein
LSLEAFDIDAPEHVPGAGVEVVPSITFEDEPLVPAGSVAWFAVDTLLPLGAEKLPVAGTTGGTTLPFWITGRPGTDAIG